MPTLGTKLTKLRKQKGISQTELAAAIDVSQSAYNKWESDIARPNIENLLKICDYFKIDFADLLDDNKGIVYSNNTFDNSNIFNNTENPIFNMHSPELIDRVLKNQEQITEILTVQNKLIEALIGKIKE